MTETIAADIRKKNPSQSTRLVEAIRTDAGDLFADKAAQYIDVTRENFEAKDTRFGAILIYEPGTRILEVEYSTMNPMEWTLRDTAITFAYHARLPEGVMNMAVDFNQARPVVNDEDDPIMLVLDFDEHTPSELFSILYGMFGNNAFASDQFRDDTDGLHGWDDAESFEVALGRAADMHHLDELMNEMEVPRTVTVREVRDRLEDLQFFPTLDKYGWPKWSKAAVGTGVSIIEHERQ